MGKEETGGLASALPPLPRRAGAGQPPNRTEEFESFKRGRGAEMNKTFIENKAVLRDKRKNARDAAIELNSIKEMIDEAKLKLDAKLAERSSGEHYDPNSENVVIDEEEFELLKLMKQLKAAYRVQFGQLKTTRSEIEYCSRLVDQCRQRLMIEFEQWFENSYGQIDIADPNNANLVEDVIDIGEKFDRLQSERMSHEDPDSLPYYNARKTVERKKGIQKAKAKSLVR